MVVTALVCLGKKRMRMMAKQNFYYSFGPGREKRYWFQRASELLSSGGVTVCAGHVHIAAKGVQVYALNTEAMVTSAWATKVGGEAALASGGHDHSAVNVHTSNLKSVEQALNEGRRRRWVKWTR